MSYTAPSDDRAPVYFWPKDCDACEYRLVGDVAVCWKHLEDWKQYLADTVEYNTHHKPDAETYDDTVIPPWSDMEIDL